MKELQLFNFENYEENYEVRALSLNGKAYFVGKDVATILGYAKPANAISQHVDAEDKGVTTLGCFFCVIAL